MFKSTTSIHKRLQEIDLDPGHYPGQKLRLLSPVERQIETEHKSLKGDSIRPGTALSLDDTRRLVGPPEILAGRQQEIHAERDRKLEVARKQRQIRRRQAA